jgi:hypothetical protein
MADLPEESSLQSAATFPDEPFACPHCGQMVAASVRVCPSCREAIDPNDIVTPEVVIPVVEQPPAPAPREHARFSWSIFFATLGIWLLAALVAQSLVGPEKSQIVLVGLLVLSSAWVYRDAREKNIPTPFRWTLGSILLWIIIFPWYLARRRTPSAPCPFIEGEGGRVARTLLFILLIIFLISIVVRLMSGPSKPSSGEKAPAKHGASEAAGKIAALPNSAAAQAAASAPSDALHT